MAKTMSSSSERRRSSLLSQLGKAQSKISALEEFLVERERQLHSAVSRLERNDFTPVRAPGRRRIGLSHDLLRMRSSSRSSIDSSTETSDLIDQPLMEYARLTISRVLDSSDSSVPFVLRRLVSREYHIGPEGAVIGSDSQATVCVPTDAGVLAKHVEIKWHQNEVSLGSSDILSGRRGSRLSRQSRMSITTDPRQPTGYFTISDLTEGKGVFYIRSNTIQNLTILEQPETDYEPSSILNDDRSSTTTAEELDTVSLDGAQVLSGVTFVVGRLELKFTALPTNLVLMARAFNAIEQGSLDRLKSVLDSDSATVHRVLVSPSQDDQFSTISTVNEDGLDLNTEYEAPSYNDENWVIGRSRRSFDSRSSFPASPLSPMAVGGEDKKKNKSHKLLLHLAIEKGNVEMVKFLLERGANVNLCSGELHQNALHLAALKNLPEVMTLLLEFGGDIEIKDSRSYQPLALTSNYKIRKMLLGTALLCSASEAGDQEEVVRLVGSSRVSPNAKGLRHKNALHLACARGHMNIVIFIVLNEANVNSRGGSKQWTPLHYASFNDHVDIARLLLEAGANEFVLDAYGHTPLNLSKGGEMCKLLYKEPLSLCLAVQSGDIEAVRRILWECESEVGGGEGREKLIDQRNQDSHAPLHLAATTGNIAIAQLLVSHGANVNLTGGRDGWTPLFYAAMAGNDHLVEFLLSVGGQTEAVDAQGLSVNERVEKALEETREQVSKLEEMGRLVSVVETPHLQPPESLGMVRQESSSTYSAEREKTWLSTRCQKLSHVSKLLTSEAERLLKAIETKDLSSFQNLLRCENADPNCKVDKHCPTSVLVRVCEAGLTEFVKCLLECKVNVNEGSTCDQIALLVAAREGYGDIVQLLVENGASITVQSTDTRSTVLHEAAMSDNQDTIEYLVALPGVDLTALDSEGNTPFDCSSVLEIRRLLAVGANRLLIAASTGDDAELLHLVQEEGVSPSQEFKQGLCALHEACDAGHVSTVQLLIDLQADVNKQTHVSLLSPLHIASQNDLIEIAELLIKAGAKLDLKDIDGKAPFEVARSNNMRKVLVEARPVRVLPVEADQDSRSSLNNKCMICMDNTINTIILPCGHQAFCTVCVTRISVCALDRQPIREVITVFK